MRPLILAMWIFCGCGTDERTELPARDSGLGHDAALVDARVIDARLVDAMPSDTPDAGATVTTVTCAGGEPIIKTTNGTMAYMPDTVTINAGEVVKFVMSTKHDVATDSDPGLVVGFGDTKCLQFAATGSFGFHCSTHGFTGTVVVQ